MKPAQITLSDIPRFAPATITVGRDYSIELRVDNDQDTDAPWEQSDGHGPISEWTTRDKRPGEWVLCEDRRSKRYYDAQAATRIARRERWNHEPYTGTPGQCAARAVAADFEYLRAWCAGEWQYVGVQIIVSWRGAVVARDALWGVESLRDYWRDVALEMVNDALSTHAIQRTHAVQAACVERREVRYWAQRDVRTI